MGVRDQGKKEKLVPTKCREISFLNTCQNRQGESRYKAESAHQNQAKIFQPQKGEKMAQKNRFDHSTQCQASMPLGKEIAWCHAAAGGTLDCGSLLPLSANQPAGAGRSRLRAPSGSRLPQSKGWSLFRKTEDGKTEDTRQDEERDRIILCISVKSVVQFPSSASTHYKSVTREGRFSSKSKFRRS